ncbi:hypothetical protein QVD17_31942 [Tagetes erecta]|uniref:Serine/threonine-protein kinase PRP4 homolog n=1 Tax=Tagetes erecta TaxID=13708 RepID=A0AAD8K4C7_TARER|nr:hypothetical protein QVD17_31942 [Tagetes erecta]
MPVLNHLPVVSLRTDDEMEEGEIVEEDGGVVEKKIADSDDESGEIKTETHGDTVEPDCSFRLPLDDEKSQRIGRHLKDGDRENNGSKTKEHSDNGYMKVESQKGSGSRNNHYGDENDDYETRDHKKLSANENHVKAHKDSSSKDVTSRSRSNDHSRDRSRSRSQSISRGASRLEKHKEDTGYHRSKKTSGNGDNEITNKHITDYRHGSRDLVRDKERERSSSRSRHSLQLDTRDRDRYREGDLKEFERERMRRDRDRERDRERERDRDRDRERDRNMRDRGRRDRERERERDRDLERENRSRRSYNYNDGDRDKSYDYKRHRDEEIDYKDKPRKSDPQKDDSFKDADADTKTAKRDEVDEEIYEEKSALQMEEDEEEDDLNRIKEESRRRRQAILEKYKTKPLQQQKQPSQLVDEAKKNVEESEGAAKVKLGTLDGQGEGSDTNTGDTPFSVGKSPPQNGNSGVQRTSGTGGLGEGTPKSERSNEDDIFGESPPRAHETSERLNDMFSDDIFGESPAGVRKSGKGDGLIIQRSGLQDNWDDAEGYYSYRFGEVLDGRYEVLAAHGKGVFSTVVRAKDLKAGLNDPEEVAIKIIRNNDKMYKAGLEELVILKKLVGADLEDRRHCVRFLSSFKYRNHLCLVFESLHMNLREVLKKFGRNIGLKLTAVRAYGKQLFIALKHLRNCGVLHTDIKPDNMLVNDAKNVLKLCDFGNAMFAGKNEITPYLVSRFYRAPEIILGLTYDHPVDMWSVGCCLFELYTGKVLFPGATNNDMLRLHMELKGPFPKKMLRKGAFTELHFDQDFNFVAIEEDPVTKKTVKRLVNMKAKDIGSIVMSSPGEDPKMLANFKDLLEKIFILDPDKRITVQQALSHPFITGK